MSALEELRQLEDRIAQKDYSQATLSLAERVVAQFPQLSHARFIFGSMLLARGRPQEALEVLAAVAAKEPRHIGAHINLGEAYLVLGRRLEAAGEFRAALALDPRNERAVQMLKGLQ